MEILLIVQVIDQAEMPNIIWFHILLWEFSAFLSSVLLFTLETVTVYLSMCRHLDVCELHNIYLKLLHEGSPTLQFEN